MMKTGFKEHLIFGLAALVFLVLVVMILAPKPALLMIAASIAFMLGALMPDVDAPFSIVRRAMTAVLFIALLFASLAFVYIFRSPLSQACTTITGLGTALCTASLVLLALVIPVFAIVLFNLLLPGHRGLLHGFLAAFLYAGFLSIIAFAFRLPLDENLFIACAGFTGYTTHILADIFGGLVPFGRK